MKNQLYVLEDRYNEIEDRLAYVQNVLKTVRRPVGMTVSEQVEELRETLLGAHDICSIFEDMIARCNRTISIASCALRDLEKIREEHPEVIIRSCIRSEDPDRDIAKAAMLLSEFTPAVNERIISSIYASHELFFRNQLDRRMTDVFEEG